MSKYLKYIIKNTAPVRIANDETSQHGQTDTLRYFPGSTIRGYIITSLSQNADFESYKQDLFSGKIQFLNAYPYINDKEMLPSLKGFYEDKSEVTGKKELNNVVVEDEVTPGNKRASLGHFCFIEDDCIRYADVEVSEDININIGREEAKRTVFRSQYMKKNQTFTGFIAFADDVPDSLIRQIMETMDHTMYLGNRRSAGYGECICVSRQIQNEIPYDNVRTSKGGDVLYMILLSDTVMRDSTGELTGLCLEELAGQLGCGKLDIEKCSTSTTDIRGYNSMWQNAAPSAVMYAAGSVFKLKASDPVAEDRLHMLEESGIGIRREEGFGQVAFIQNYEKIRYKSAIQSDERQCQEIHAFGKKADVESDIRIAASGLVRNRIERAIEWYVVQQKLDMQGISESKKGLLMSKCMELCYQPSEAKDQLIAFVTHIQDKDDRSKTHNGKARQDKLIQYVHKILETDLYDILGLKWTENKVMGLDIHELLSQNEIMQYRLKLMIKQLRYANRGGKK